MLDSREGGRAVAGDLFGIAAIGAGGALASVSSASIVKRKVGPGGVFLTPSGGGVSKSVAVGTLGVALTLRHFLDLKAL